MMSDCRALAAGAVAGVAGRGQSLGAQLARAEAAVKPRDRALLRELCYGSLRWYPQLAGLVQPLLAKPFKEKDFDLQALLVVGAYQLLHTRIPDHAALAATVEAARALGKGWATGLVNGVLRNLQRRSGELRDALPPAAAAAHPDWLWQRLHADWPAQAEAIASANNAHPPMCLRVNRTRGDVASYMKALAACGIDAAPGAWASDCIRLVNPVDVGELPGFGDGLVSVQDEAAQLAAALLAVEPGQRVLDACCAPGGKTGHLLESQPRLAELWALDSSADRLRRVADNLARLQVSAHLLVGDARATGDWWDGRLFDRILLDAPCSGTGVIRRHPDIKLLRTSADITQLAALQWQLLDALWPLLAPGGVLLYATCSVLPAENAEVIARFLAATPDAAEWPIDVEWGLPQPVGRQLLPAVQDSDGFFYARLRRVSPIGVDAPLT